MNEKLSGLRVLDLTHMLSGPYAGMTLADLGASLSLSDLLVQPLEPFPC